MQSLVVESIVGYVFWTLFHAMGPMIWFYPLNELDVTGYEAFVLCVFTPVILLSQTLKNNFVGSTLFQVLMTLVMLAGISSFQAPSTLHRLIILCIGVGGAMLFKSSRWWSCDSTSCKRSFWGFTIGFLMLLSSRVWFTSITPAWSDHSSNKLIATIFSISVGMFIINSLNKSEQTNNVRKEALRKNDSSILRSVAYGSACFLMHTFIGEASVLSRYTVSGLQVSSPLPNPWGGAVLLAVLFGFLLSFYSDLPSNTLWLASGILSSLGVMFLPTWYAFACGLHFVIFICSVWPSIGENVINCANPGKCLLLANFVYLFEIFGLVWCTAYNFVPFGGELARERTYAFILFASTLVSLSLMKSKPSNKIPIRIRLELPNNEPVDDNENKEGISIKNIIFTIILIGLLGFNYRNYKVPKPNINLEAQQKGQFSALIWTFHFGYDNQGWPSLERAAQVLNNTGADVITLLESDASKPYLGNKDIGMWFGEKLGMYVDFGPSTRDHTWGTLLMSKYPIVTSKHHLLPSPKGELAPAISATVDINGKLVDFVVTHMGNHRDNLDRRLQAEYLSKLTNSTDNPVVFLGYVTSSPGSRDYRHLTQVGRLNDIDSTDRDRWCEYIMYRGLKRLGYARISHSGLSDTELQMARWQFFDNPQLEKDNKNIAKDGDDAIEEVVKFNKVFGERYVGHWYDQSKHHFHMDTPKYFKP